MPTSSQKKINLFLELIFEGVKDQKGNKEIKIHTGEYIKYSSIVFGSAYRTLKDYEKLMVSFQIIRSKNSAYVIFDREKYEDYLKIQDKIKRLSEGYE